MAKPSSKESKGKKRKLSTVEVQEEHDESSVYDLKLQEERSHQEPSAPASKRARQSAANELDTSKPSAVFKPKKGRDWTLSIALPGSFIANTKVPGQKNDLAARIARAAAVFCVDEVVVFDDDPTTIPPQLIKRKGKKPQTKAEALAGVEPYNEPFDNPDQFLYHLLSYLECPGHLRKHLFPEHDNLRSAGQLPTLDMPHHMRAHEWCQYREGAALGPVSARNHVKSKKARSNGSEAAAEQATLVDCGLSHPVTVPYAIPPGTRVTLRFADSEPPPSWPHLSEDEIAELKVEPTTSDEPREKAGYYWGFSVRKADSLSAVYTESPFAPDGYDFSLGTSERGVPLSSIFPDSPKNSTKRTSSSDQTDKLPPKFQHLLLVFGGVAGLEPAVASDPVLKEKGLTKETAHNAFDLWVNLVPGQGSRTIRTEEAVWLGLMGLRDYVTSMS